MKQSPKQFFATPAGKLTLAIIAMVFCWTALIVYLSSTSTGGTWFPTETDMNRVRQEIKKDTSTLTTEQANLDAFDELQAKYEDSLATFWNADRDGEPETELRNLVNDAAQRAQANLQTLGSVRTSNINGELSYADLDFTLVDEYNKVIRFFAEVEKCTPRLSWRRVEIRVEPTRARAVTGPGARQNNTTTVTTTAAQTFRTTGQVRVIKYSPAGNSSTGKTATAAAAKPATTAATATKQPAASTPAAQQQPAAAEAAAESAPAASTPAQTESASKETNNEENEK